MCGRSGRIDQKAASNSAATLAKAANAPRVRRASSSAVQPGGVERVGEAVPVLAAALRVAAHVAGAECLVKADLGGLLEQERRAEVGALGDIEPAHPGRDVDGAGEHRRLAVRQVEPEVAGVLLGQRQAAAPGEVGDEGRQRRVGIQRVDVAEEPELHPHEPAVAAGIPERVGGHDAGVERAVDRVGLRLQPAPARLLRRWCVHGRAPVCRPSHRPGPFPEEPGRRHPRGEGTRGLGRN